MRNLIHNILTEEANNDFDLKGKSWHIDIANEQENREAQEWLFKQGFRHPMDVKPGNYRPNRLNLQSVWSDNIEDESFTGTNGRNSWSYKDSVRISTAHGYGKPIHIIWSDVRDILVDFDPFENLYESKIEEINEIPKVGDYFIAHTSIGKDITVGKRYQIVDINGSLHDELMYVVKNDRNSNHYFEIEEGGRHKAYYKKWFYLDSGEFDTEKAFNSLYESDNPQKESLGLEDLYVGMRVIIDGTDNEDEDMSWASEPGTVVYNWKDDDTDNNGFIIQFDNPNTGHKGSRDSIYCPQRNCYSFYDDDDGNNMMGIKMYPEFDTHSAFASLYESRIDNPPIEHETVIVFPTGTDRKILYEVHDFLVHLGYEGLDEENFNDVFDYLDNDGGVYFQIDNEINSRDVPQFVYGAMDKFTSDWRDKPRIRYQDILDVAGKDFFPLNESENSDFDWLEKPNVDDKDSLEGYLRLLLRENNFELIPEYKGNTRYLVIRDRSVNQDLQKVKYSGHGKVYYVFPTESFNKDYLKRRIRSHNFDYPTPKSLDWTVHKSYFFKKYKKIEQIINTIVNINNITESEDDPLEWAKDAISQDPFIGRHVRINGKIFAIEKRELNLDNWKRPHNRCSWSGHYPIIGEIVYKEVDSYIIDMGKQYPRVYFPKTEFKFEDIQ